MKKKEIVKALHEQMEGIHVSSDLRQQTLARISEKEEKIMKKKLPVAVVAVALSLLLSAAALAAASRMGLVDYFTRISGTEIPQTAAENIQTNVATNANDLVSVQVRELYYDGVTALAVVDVIPKAEHMLLVGVDALMDDSLQNLFIEEDKALEGRTIRDFFREQEYKAAYRVNVGIGAPDGIDSESRDFFLNEDGGLTYYCTTAFDGMMPEREAELLVDIYRCADENGDAIEDVPLEQIIRLNQPLTLNVAAQETNQLYVSTEPQRIEDADIEIEEMRVWSTLLELKVEIDYTCPAQIDDDIILEVIDPESMETSPYLQRLEDGVNRNGSTHVEAGSERNRYTQRLTLSVDELKDRYTLRVFDYMTKERFGTVTMTMHPATAEELAARVQTPAAGAK